MSSRCILLLIDAPLQMQLKTRSLDCRRFTHNQYIRFSGENATVAGSNALIFLLVFMSIGVALFVAYMRFRDVGTDNLVDRSVCLLARSRSSAFARTVDCRASNRYAQQKPALTTPPRRTTTMKSLRLRPQKAKCHRKEKADKNKKWPRAPSAITSRVLVLRIEAYCIIMYFVYTHC